MIVAVQPPTKVRFSPLMKQQRNSMPICVNLRRLLNAKGE